MNKQHNFDEDYLLAWSFNTTKVKEKILSLICKHDNSYQNVTMHCLCSISFRTVSFYISPPSQ